MAKDIKKCFSSQLVNISALFIALLGFFTYAEVAGGAPSNTIETSREVDQAEPSGTVPSRITIARVQSAAQKIVTEEASQNKTTVPTPSPKAVPQSGGRVKKGRNAADSSSSDQSEMRQVRGSSAIQDDDSLSTGKAGKGKSAAKKEESF